MGWLGFAKRVDCSELGTLCLTRGSLQHEGSTDGGNARGSAGSSVPMAGMGRGTRRGLQAVSMARSENRDAFGSRNEVQAFPWPRWFRRSIDAQDGSRRYLQRRAFHGACVRRRDGRGFQVRSNLPLGCLGVFLARGSQSCRRRRLESRPIRPVCRLGPFAPRSHRRRDCHRVGSWQNRHQHRRERRWCLRLSRRKAHGNDSMVRVGSAHRRSRIRLDRCDCKEMCLGRFRIARLGGSVQGSNRAKDRRFEISRDCASDPRTAQRHRHAILRKVGS